jgi:hypothetical protein
LKKGSCYFLLFHKKLNTFVVSKNQAISGSLDVGARKHAKTSKGKYKFASIVCGKNRRSLGSETHPQNVFKFRITGAAVWRNVNAMLWIADGTFLVSYLGNVGEWRLPERHQVQDAAK